jgi:hypothetical protein
MFWRKKKNRDSLPVVVSDDVYQAWGLGMLKGHYDFLFEGWCEHCGKNVEKGRMLNAPQRGVYMDDCKTCGNFEFGQMADLDRS